MTWEDEAGRLYFYLANKVMGNQEELHSCLVLNFTSDTPPQITFANYLFDALNSNINNFVLDDEEEEDEENLKPEKISEFILNKYAGKYISDLENTQQISELILGVILNFVADSNQEDCYKKGKNYKKLNSAIQSFLEKADNMARFLEAFDQESKYYERDLQRSIDESEAAEDAARQREREEYLNSLRDKQAQQQPYEEHEEEHEEGREEEHEEGLNGERLLGSIPPDETPRSLNTGEIRKKDGKNSGKSDR